MSNDTAIAVDVAKNVFQLGVSDRPGKMRRTERLQRSQFLPFLATQPRLGDVAPTHCRIAEPRQLPETVFHVFVAPVAFLQSGHESDCLGQYSSIEGRLPQLVTHLRSA